MEGTSQGTALVMILPTGMLFPLHFSTVQAQCLYFTPSTGSQWAFAFIVMGYSTSNRWIFSSQLITHWKDPEIQML